MNNVLQLKGRFQGRKNNSSFGPMNLPKDSKVSVIHLQSLRQQLQQISGFWKNESAMIGGALVSVHYRQVVAKSNRLKTLLGEGSRSPNESIRGAKFKWDIVDENSKPVPKHIFTHFISLSTIDTAIEKLDKSIKTIQELFGDSINTEDINRVNEGFYNDKYISKSPFIKTVVDGYFVERFDIDRDTKEIQEQSIITLYKTGVDTRVLLEKLGINAIGVEMLDDTTVRLRPDEIKILLDNVPYLIAMDVKEWADIAREENTVFEEADAGKKIPNPTNEPIVGVIDTQFDENVYFTKWVDYENMLNPDFEIGIEDKFHGTAVSSIIVDGPSFNPNLEDGCGRFQVKHFGVATARRFSSFTILKLIRQIVQSNPSIKVWNLSLGSEMEINKNFISVEGAELDRIQSKYNVIFVVAGTNKTELNKAPYRIGAPADSLNSLVVNAVDFTDSSASYTRVGPVLSFFHKPDVSYYGGDGKDKILVCAPNGSAYVVGTSFAAPWITRKVAYLIYVMGLSREVAKAIIIDSAAGWNCIVDSSYRMGYGIVPKHINDIIYSQDDEIRFILSGTIDEYETYTYNLPVPMDKSAHPYFARTTLAYFPNSDRNQGVDYTSTEMDIHFGRLNENRGKVEIKSINGNKQADDTPINLYEESARKLFRKWDNIKHVAEYLNPRGRPRKAYESGMWGISIKTKERVKANGGRGLQFGLVVTLKEMNGVNRIDEFMKLCMVRGWLVNRLDVENQIDVYLKAEEEINFE